MEKGDTEMQEHTEPRDAKITMDVPGGLGLHRCPR